MPLQFEEIPEDSPNSILCFVPNGVLGQNGEWQDFPAQMAETCVYTTSEFIARLRFTTRPFNPEASYNLKAIYNYKRQLIHLDAVGNLILRVILCLNIIKLNLTDPQDIVSLLNAFSARLDLQGLQRCTAPLMPDENLKLHLDEISKICAANPDIMSNKLFKDSLPKFRDILLNANATPEIINSYIKEYFYSIELVYMQSMFNSPEFKLFLASQEIDFSEADRVQAGKSAAIKVHYRRSIIQSLLNVALGLRTLPITYTDTPTPATFKLLLREILEKRGPVQISACIGLPAYLPDSTFVLSGKFGSRELIGFKRGTYIENKRNSHAITVIGIMNDHVVYLDPMCPIPKGGSRQAFVVSIDRLYSSMKECSAILLNDKNSFQISFNANTEEIDTTAEMMASHTKSEHRVRPKLSGFQ